MPGTVNVTVVLSALIQKPDKLHPFKDEAQAALFKDPARTAL
jgi:hypothetical protein